MAGAGSELEERVLRLAEPLAASLGLAVVDVRYGRRAGRGVLEVCVDRARGDADSPPPEPGGERREEAPAAARAGGQREETAARGGVTLAECEALSRRLSVLLDVEDPVRGSYVLEVASPGLDRVLRREREFEHFRGRRVRVRAAEGGRLVPVAAAAGALGEATASAGMGGGGDAPGVAGQARRMVEGELIGLVGGAVRVRDDDGRQWEVALRDVARAELVPELR